MDDNSKNLDYGSIEELAKAAEAGDPEALAKMQDLAQAMRPVLDAVAKNLQPLKEVQESIKATLSRVTENLQPLQQMQESLRKFAAEMAAWNMEHSEALEVLQDETKTQAFLEKLTVDDLRAALDEPTVRKVAPMLSADLSGGRWLEILDNMELGEAVALYEYVTSKPTEYRTRSKAGEVVDVPEQLALISSKPYKFALTYYSQYQEQNAYLFLLKDAVDLNVEKDGTFTIKGLPVTSEDMQKRAEKQINAVDPGFLNVPLSIIYKAFTEKGEVRDVYSVYVPDLISKMHKANPGENSIKAVITNFSQYDNLVGMLRVKKNGRYYKKYYKVMIFLGYNDETKCIEFSSPFITHMLREAYESSIRLDSKTKKPRKLLSNGLYDTKPYVTQVATLKLKGERNSRAVRIVEIIVTLVEETGSGHTPNISAKKILEYMPDFAQDIENTAAASNRNLKLKRAFKRAFEILNEEPGKDGKTRAGLKEKYKNIQMPAVTDWPTMATLSKVYYFPHEGKIKDDTP